MDQVATDVKNVGLGRDQFEIVEENTQISARRDSLCYYP